MPFSSPHSAPMPPLAIVFRIRLLHAVNLGFSYGKRWVVLRCLVAHFTKYLHSFLFGRVSFASIYQAGSIFLHNFRPERDHNLCI